MRGITSFIAILLVGACLATQDFDNNDEIVEITESFYIKDLNKYTSDHDIIKIVVPLNALNFDSDSSESNTSSDDYSDITIFFVEADVDEKSNRVYKGLYSLMNGQAKKLLENGRDAAASSDSSKQVFFGAKDGIYIYNEDQSVTKYGFVIESIVNIAKTTAGDDIYILTEDKNVYKVSEHGMKKEKLDDIVQAKQIVLDRADNIYFISEDSGPYVKSNEGVKKFKGLPENPTKVELIKAPSLLGKLAMCLFDNTLYLMYANGTVENSGFRFKPEASPSALALEATLLQYYAHNKKIYEYNVLTLNQRHNLENIENFISGKNNEIGSLAKHKSIA